VSTVHDSNQVIIYGLQLVLCVMNYDGGWWWVEKKQLAESKEFEYTTLDKMHLKQITRWLRVKVETFNRKTENIACVGPIFK
jgi:hypothetical protein